MRLLGWLVAAVLFLSPIIVSGLLVWQSQDDGIYSLAQEEADALGN